MRQLDAEGYRTVDAMMREVGELGAIRLQVYEQAKEVVAEGCQKDASDRCSYSCTSLAAPLCKTLVDIVAIENRLDEEAFAYELARSQPKPSKREKLLYFVR